MRGYPHFSFWISIALAKICFSRIVISQKCFCISRHRPEVYLSVTHNLFLLHLQDDLVKRYRNTVLVTNNVSITPYWDCLILIWFFLFVILHSLLQYQKILGKSSPISCRCSHNTLVCLFFVVVVVIVFFVLFCFFLFFPA